MAEDVGLYVVADGVGGNAAGEVASRLVVDSIVAFFRDIALDQPGAGDEQGMARHASFTVDLFARAAEEANAVVWSAAAANPAMAGMATTFTGVLLRHEYAVVAHVGDSRAYLLRGRQLRQLTDDHSALAAYVRAGLIAAEDAAAAELRGKIVRAVGLDDHVEVDTRVVAVEPGDPTASMTCSRTASSQPSSSASAT
jgi:protein phosphatase